jgi:hypothetical protein
MLRAALSVAICSTLACSSADEKPNGNAGGSATGGTDNGAAGNKATGGANAGGTEAGSSAGGTDQPNAGTTSGGTTSGGTTSGDAGKSGAAGAGGAPNPLLEKFSFFVTSLSSIKKVSGSDQGFGGDLRFGEDGEGAGLRGADKICKAVAELGMPGAGAKQWRAFLSATKGGDGGGPVHAKSRIGNGPWYDATGRLVAMTLADLIGGDRPIGADPAIRDDLPNEFGIPNHTADAPGCTGSQCPDNHQVLTGTNCAGELYTGGGQGGGIMSTCKNVTPVSGSPDVAFTCNDWTSKAEEGSPWCGHSWPRQGSGLSWISSALDGGCAPCVRVQESGGVTEACVGSAGGYGGFYCFEEK